VVGNDEDFWEIVVPANTEMQIDILHSASIEDLDVDLYFGGIEVDSGATGSDNETVNFPNFSDQDVVVDLRVFVWSSSTPSPNACNNYNIVTTLLPLATCLEDVFEPNNSFATASPAPLVAVGASVNPADPDYYSVDVEAFDTVEATVAFVSDGFSADVGLFDAAGNELDVDFFGTERVVSSTYTGVVPSVYTVEVTSGECEQYSIAAEVFAASSCFTDVFEPNDASFNAPFLAEGFTAGLSTGPTDEDYWRVRLQPNQRLDVSAFTNSPADALELRILNRQGTQLLEQDTGGAPSVSLWNTNATARTVAVGVEADSCTDYDLDMAIVDGPACGVADAAEPNNTFLNATVLDGFTSPLPNLSTSPSDPDRFAIQVPNGHRLTAQMNVSLTAGSPSLFLYDIANGPPRDTDSFGPTYDVSAVNTSGSTATWWLDAEGSDCTGYDLDWDLIACGTDDALEPNDSPSLLVTVVAGDDLIVTSDSEDYFFVGTVDPGETVTANLSFIDALGDIDADLEDANGNDLPGTSGGAGISDEENVVWTNNTGVSQPVILHVFVFGNGTCTSNTYDFDVTIDDAP
jgi:hypothetical protein